MGRFGKPSLVLAILILLTALLNSCGAGGVGREFIPDAGRRDFSEYPGLTSPAQESGALGVLVGGKDTPETGVIQQRLDTHVIQGKNGKSVALADILTELDALPPPADVDADVFEQLKSALAEELSINKYAGLTSPAPDVDWSVRATPVKKFVSKPPTGDANRIIDLELIDNLDGTFRLTWSYRNVGDFNQDGVVSIADISKLAEHFQSSAGDPTYRVFVDGNGDGTISIGDITVLAERFFNQVSAYNVEGAAEGSADFTVLATIPFASSTGGETGWRTFSTTVDMGEFAQFRVTPLDADSEAGVSSKVETKPYSPPVVQSVSLHSGITTTEVSVTATVAGGSPPLAYEWDFGGGAEPNFSSDEVPTVTLGIAGTYTGSVTVSDATASDTFSFDYEVTEFGVEPRIISVVAPGGGEGEVVVFSVEATGTDTLGFSWDLGGGGNADNPNARQTNVTLGSAGTYTGIVVVGNQYGSDQQDFIYEVTEVGEPPIIVSLDNPGGEAGADATFSAVVTGTEPIAYTWNFGGGASPNISSDPSPTVTLGASGSYSAILMVTNDFGTDEMDFTLIVNEPDVPPSILSVSPTSGLEGSSTTFSAVVNGSVPFTYSWNFGGGASPNTSADASPTVTLGSAGEYLASLTVMNSAGSDTFDFALTVEPAGGPKTWDVDIISFTFSPNELTIRVGDTVRWTNRDSVNHTTTSDDGTTWDSDFLGKDQSFSFTFTSVGTFPYHCSPHPFMTGTITVTE